MATLRIEQSYPVSAETLWGAVGFGALADWHPMVPNLELTEEGKVRTMGFGAMAAVERLVEEGERSYTYVVDRSPMPVRDYRATWTVADADEGSTITIEATYEPKGPEAASDMLLRAFFAAGFKALGSKLV
ncbi:MAG: SRPBCC family protein [Proteobacteria bacterium]|nr:SRPBCC family protein [Pseudomonadota bacterium]